MICLAKDGMRQDLERIYRLCFPEDSIEYSRAFFDRRYNPNSCIVYVDEEAGRAVAMLHLLDAFITDDSEIIPVQYVYAAATRPDHQGKGIMGRLLEAAQLVAKRRNIRYSVLVPGSHSLCRYYEKHGYLRCFKARMIAFSRREMEYISDWRKYQHDANASPRYELSSVEVFSIRRDNLVDREGYISWDRNAVAYACDVQRVAGGAVIATAQGSEAAYAFCGCDGKNVNVTEFVAPSGLEKQLVRVILGAYPSAERFSFRVPASNEFFSPYGDIDDFGMIRTTDGSNPTSLLTLTGRHLPYIGLALD